MTAFVFLSCVQISDILFSFVATEGSWIRISRTSVHDFSVRLQQLEPKASGEELRVPIGNHDRFRRREVAKVRDYRLRLRSCICRESGPRYTPLDRNPTARINHRRLTAARPPRRHVATSRLKGYVYSGAHLIVHTIRESLPPRILPEVRGEVVGLSAACPAGTGIHCHHRPGTRLQLAPEVIIAATSSLRECSQI